MNVTKIVVRQAVTMNMGNYNSNQVEIILEAELEDEDVEQAHDALVKQAKNLLYKQHVKPNLSTMPKPMQDYWSKFFSE